MRIAQINVTSNLSTGRIALELCRICNEQAHQTLLCYSRGPKPIYQMSYRVGSGRFQNSRAEQTSAVRFSRKAINKVRAVFKKAPLKPKQAVSQLAAGKNDSVYRNRINTNLHVLTTRIFDRPGFFKTPFINRQTQKLIDVLETFQPDIVHLHNIHGYYVYLPALFEYLKQRNIPVVWTLHDCWSYTGHCAYYSIVKTTDTNEVGCTRWKNGCYHCPQIHSYPSSWFVDNCKQNWLDKKALFTSLPYLIPVTPSKWLYDEAVQSFWKPFAPRMRVIPSGIDLTRFHAVQSGEEIIETLSKYGINYTEPYYLLLSVAAVWEKRKGIEDLIQLSRKLGRDYRIICIGLDEAQIAAVPENTVIPLPRTESVEELCAFYTSVDLYISASYEETQGMTLIESLACGTQVLCYRATALPELVTDAVGCTVPTGDINALAEAVKIMCDHPKREEDCLAWAKQFDSEQCFKQYLQLYESMYRFSCAAKSDEP